MPGGKGKKRQSQKKKQKRPKASEGFGLAGFLKRTIFALSLLLCLALAALTGVYFFGPFERRTQMESFAADQLYALRRAHWMPGPGGRILAAIEDLLPADDGYAVDAGELGRDGTHFLAGLPHSQKPLWILKNKSYVTLYDAAEQQPRCVALRLTGDRADKIPKVEHSRRDDPRTATPSPASLQLGEWKDFPLAPLEAIIREHGPIGLKEANLTSNLIPMSQTFAETVWHPLLRRLSIEYPQRFDEVWLCLGPVYQTRLSRLSSGVPRPDAYFVIVFDETDAGALRAISFLVPADARPKNPEAFLSSMEQIEGLTGLQFLPELRPHTRRGLAEWVSPRLW